MCAGRLVWNSPIESLFMLSELPQEEKVLQNQSKQLKTVDFGKTSNFKARHSPHAIFDGKSQPKAIQFYVSTQHPKRYSDRRGNF